MNNKNKTCQCVRKTNNFTIGTLVLIHIVPLDRFFLFFHTHCAKTLPKPNTLHNKQNKNLKNEKTKQSPKQPEFNNACNKQIDVTKPLLQRK